MKIEEVLERHSDGLISREGVVGVGIAEDGGRPVISVMVRELTPGLKRELPHELDGFPVKVEAIGDVSAF